MKSQNIPQPKVQYNHQIENKAANYQYLAAFAKFLVFFRNNRKSHLSRQPAFGTKIRRRIQPQINQVLRTFLTQILIQLKFNTSTFTNTFKNH